MGSLKIVVAVAVGCFLVMFFLVARQFGVTDSIPSSEVAAEPRFENGDLPDPAALNSGNGKSLPAENPAVDPEYAQRRNAYLSLFQKGEYAAASSLVEALLRDYPSDPGLQKDFATCLFAEALQAFEKFDYEVAAQKLRRSAALGNEQAKLALAKVLVMKGQTSEAIQLLAKEFAARPTAKTLEGLIDLNLTSGSSEEAERYLNVYEKMYSASNEESPNQNKESKISDESIRAAAKLFLESRRKRFNTRRKIEDENFILSKDDVQVRYPSRQAEGLAEKILAKVTQTVDALKAKFGSTTWGANFDIELVLESDFSNLTGAPPWAAAIFDGTIRLPFASDLLRRGADSYQIERNAVHETTHAFLYALCGDRIPSWLGEGLAQIQEGRSDRSAVQGLKNSFGSSWVTLGKSDILDRPFIQVAGSSDVRDLYMRSIVLTAALERSGGPSVWRRFVMQMCTNETPLPEALESTFGGRTSAELWEQYIQKKQ
jgi:hypothetical protein